MNPPFAAPPTEGRNRRLWLGLGVGALIVLLCCGGGGAAIIGLGVTNVRAVDEQGRAVTDDYYQALVEKRYGEAYDMLCPSERGRESKSEFEQRVGAEPQVSSFRVRDVDEVTLTVAVDVTYDDGDRDTRRVVLELNDQTAGMEVCGVE
ncbi:Rv0361 family membrane protein [Micromonospora sp. SH-82]|uniref:Rv0361 family membrane protein n=1 Tax=Micromonospora sp. SH-82 TaxID=3132938 RepID=UPI003EB9F60A